MAIQFFLQMNFQTPFEQGILKLSTEKKYPEALHEWKLKSLEYLERGKEFDHCFCTQYPIHRVCRIYNVTNSHSAIICATCALKFDHEPHLSNSLKIFESYKRIVQNPRSTGSSELISYAHDQGILTTVDIIEYKGHWQQLTPDEQKYKYELNNRIIKHMIRPKQAVSVFNKQAKIEEFTTAASKRKALATAVEFNFLEANPTTIASEKLVVEAYEKGVFDGQDFSLYIGALGEKEPSKKLIAILNAKMIEGFNPENSQSAVEPLAKKLFSKTEL